jgi:RimJ/RimL family protein N-acetyltransferase
MLDQPILHTDRLVLRPFLPSDAARVRELAGAFEVADTTAHIPHPYEPGMAEAWIARHPMMLADGSELVYAITLRDDGALIGAIGLMLDGHDRMAELGYWVGVPFWGRGYCTEAATAVMRLGFEELALHRIRAVHMSRNPASGRVMQKIGMQHEGRQREAMLKWEVFEDLEIYAALRGDWLALHEGSG